MLDILLSLDREQRLCESADERAQTLAVLVLGRLLEVCVGRVRVCQEAELCLGQFVRGPIAVARQLQCCRRERLARRRCRFVDHAPVRPLGLSLRELVERDVVVLHDCVLVSAWI